MPYSALQSIVGTTLCRLATEHEGWTFTEREDTLPESGKHVTSFHVVGTVGVFIDRLDADCEVVAYKGMRLPDIAIMLSAEVEGTFFPEMDHWMEEYSSADPNIACWHHSKIGGKRVFCVNRRIQERGSSVDELLQSITAVLVDERKLIAQLVYAQNHGGRMGLHPSIRKLFRHGR